MKVIAKTTDLLKAYNKGGLAGVIIYFNNENLEIKEETFVYQIKYYLEQKNYNTVNQLLDDITLKFNNYDKKSKDTKD